MYVNEFQTSTVRFSIPKATEEELRFILVRNSEMLETASDPDNLDRFLAEIADFQELTKDIDYDPELVELKDTIIDELGDRAAFLLEETMEKADKTYYAEDPDFEQASQIYSRITALVNNSFSYSFADPEGTAGISSPKEVLYAAGDILYLLDGADTPRLSSFGPDTVFIAERELIDWDGTSGNLSLAADPDGNCLVFAAGTAAVHRYTAELTDPIRLTVPDYSADPDDTLSVAVSRENTVYLVGNRQVLVFEYAIGNETTVERDNVIEQNLKNALEPYGDTPLADVFFDDSNVLHLFFPSSGEVLQCTSLGEVITSVEFPGISADSDIAVDGLGYYYFTMPEEHRVLKYSPKGEFISEFGSFGDGEGEFSRPEGIAVSGEGTVYIAEAGNKRLQVLTLTAPPLLLPEVAQYGEQFTRRKQSSEEAVEKISAVQTDGTFWKATLDFGVPAAIMGSSFALAFVDGILYRNSMNNFAEYQNSTDLEDVEEFRSRAALNWAFSRVSLYAGYAAMGAGSYWLASSIGSSIDAKVQQKRTVEYLQSFDMDKEYDVNEGKFRSLQTANILGFTTGVLPPLLGGTAALVLSFIPQVNPQISRVAAAGCIAIPPIFSHVYAGQMSWGNFVNGLIADAMAITAFLLAKDVSKSVYFDSIEDPAERGERYYNSTMEYALSDYYLFGALVFRFVAGWNDFRRGWKRANEYNTYEAVTERPSPLSFRAGPYFDENGSPGLAFTLQF